MAREAKKIKIAVILLFFLFIGLYGFYRSADLIFGIKIRDIQLNGEPIRSGAVLQESVATITGNAKNAIHLRLDGREISVDIGGNFRETIALLPGYNIMNLTAVDKFGYEDVKNYQLIFLE